jgi:predicted ester cyclase
MANVATMERPKENSMTQEELIRTFWESLINKRDNQWQQLVSPDITFVGSLSSRKWIGIEGIIEYSPLMFARFENFGIKLGEIITQGNKSVIMVTFGGRNTAGLFGNPPCGKQVNYEAVAVITVNNGKITEVKVTGNVIQILEQVGQQI